MTIITPSDFINEIIIQYRNARTSNYPNSKIARGRSHTISSVAEDLFALYLINNDSDIDMVLVDQPIFVKDAGKRFYPDISVIKDNQIVAFFDLKMDLGWMREGLKPITENHKKIAKLINNKVGCVSVKENKSKTVEYSISNKVTYDIIVISDQNISKVLLGSQLVLVEKNEFSKVYILSSKIHPNEYNMTIEENLENIQIEKDEFTAILARISGAESVL